MMAGDAPNGIMYKLDENRIVEKWSDYEMRFVKAS